MQHKILILLLSLISLQTGFSQEIIEIENPSYEGIPQHSTVAKDWTSCNWAGESLPDIQPGAFGVTNKAFDGNTYLGLVSRDNGTFEMIRTKLEKPLVKGDCYSWNFYMSQTPNYLSFSRTTRQSEPFTSPVNVVIYGSETANCKSGKLLAIAKNIRRLNKWKPYQFIFNAKEAYEYLTIAVESVDEERPTNGHMLLDYFTPLIPIDCETEKPKNVIVKTDKNLLKDINTKKGTEKLKALVEKINIGRLTENGYLDYQFYSNEKGIPIYDNIYFNELMKAFPKGNEGEIILMAKKGFEGRQMMNYLKSYIKQKELKDADFLMIPHREKLLEKYSKSHTLLFEGKDVLIFVK